jgi:isoaspartyl peptidase/L-asparaginase-like protein (Ntn-hydrolase superfamily)
LICKSAALKAESPVAQSVDSDQDAFSMAIPLMLSTWSFGQRANAAAWGPLERGGAALNAVETACRDAESDPDNHTVGVGGFPDRDGEVSLDASIMLSPSRSGAVAGVKQFAHPITIARAVMERSPHKLLIGAGAEAFAAAQGFAPGPPLLTEDAAALWQEWRRGQPVNLRNIEESSLGESHDTIGVLALDAGGTLAGGCSTSGLAFKMPGRVGDSPIVGHGLYVDPGAGAAVATGIGELTMGVCGAFLAVELLRRGEEPLEAATQVLRRIIDDFALDQQAQVGLIVLRRDGQWSSASLRSGFQVAVRSHERDELQAPARVMLND